jgi:beta-phosphoglucomutase-like phosphatase (HAD superfamily)
VVIEDFKESIRAARRAGMKCLAVTDSQPAVLLADADVVVKSLEEVKLNYLQNMRR